MAPRKRKVANATNDLTLNDSDYELLTYIASETEKNGFVYTAVAGTQIYADAGLIEINTGMRNHNGDCATRITDKGKEIIMAKKIAPVETAAPVNSNLVIGSFDFSTVKPKVSSKRRGREAKYNIDALAPGQFIFVPVSEKHPTDEAVAKSLTGTIQAANRKFAVATGETKVMKRKNKETGEAVEKQLPKLALTREFKAFPYIVDGVPGAAIVRVDGTQYGRAN